MMFPVPKPDQRWYQDTWIQALAVMVAIAFVCGLLIGNAGCQSNQPPVTRKPDCDGERCNKQTTPNDVIKQKPLVYY